MPCLLASAATLSRYLAAFLPCGSQTSLYGTESLPLYSHHFLSSLEKRAAQTADVLKVSAGEYGARAHVSAGLGLSVSDLCFWPLVM